MILALLAPDDYVHIYSNQKTQNQKMVTTAKEPKRIPSTVDVMPTALIAPDDYQNLYTVKKQQPTKNPAAADDPTVPRIPSDAPTGLLCLSNAT